MAANLNREQFKKDVLGAKEPVLIDFWAPWCGPCKMLSPIIEKVSQKAEGAKVYKVNIDEEPELATQYGVMSIPTLAVFKDGKLVRSAVGVRPESYILEMLAV